jgi:hypothetical protein
MVSSVVRRSARVNARPAAQRRNTAALSCPTPSRSPDLAARGDRNRIRQYQNEIRDNGGQITRQLAGGPIKICSGASPPKGFITVIGCQVGDKNSKAAHTLDVFDLTGEID